MPKIPTAIDVLTCIACGGTRLNSRGGPCYPCSMRWAGMVGATANRVAGVVKSERAEDGSAVKDIQGILY